MLRLYIRSSNLHQEHGYLRCGLPCVVASRVNLRVTGRCSRAFFPGVHHSYTPILVYTYMMATAA